MSGSGRRSIEIILDRDNDVDIEPHRYVRRNIRRIKNDLDKLETIVETLEWRELGGRGIIDRDYIELCDEIEFQMPLIKDDINELISYEDD